MNQIHAMQNMRFMPWQNKLETLLLSLLTGVGSSGSSKQHKTTTYCGNHAKQAPSIINGVEFLYPLLEVASFRQLMSPGD